MADLQLRGTLPVPPPPPPSVLNESELELARLQAEAAQEAEPLLEAVRRRDHRAVLDVLADGRWFVQAVQAPEGERVQVISGLGAHWVPIYTTPARMVEWLAHCGAPKPYHYLRVSGQTILREVRQAQVGAEPVGLLLDPGAGHSVALPPTVNEERGQ
jgi:hypothetical protein